MAQCRHFVAILAAVAMVGCGGVLSGNAAVVTSAASQIESQLKGTSIAKASPDQLVAAVKAAVAKNPGLAEAILTEVLSAKRSDMNEIAGRLLGACLEGLGANPAEARVVALVSLAIKIQPDSLLEFVSAAVKVIPDSMAPIIVQTAVEATKGASEATVKQVVAAAMKAKPGAHFDRVVLTAAGMKGLELATAKAHGVTREYDKLVTEGGAQAIPPRPPLSEPPSQ